MSATASAHISFINLLADRASVFCAALGVPPGDDPAAALATANAFVTVQLRGGPGRLPVSSLPVGAVALLGVDVVQVDSATAAAVEELSTLVEDDELHATAARHLVVSLHRADAADAARAARHRPLRAGNGVDPRARPFPVPADAAAVLPATLLSGRLDRLDYNCILGAIPRFDPWPVAHKLQSETLSLIPNGKVRGFFREVLPAIQQQALDQTACPPGPQRGQAGPALGGSAACGARGV